MNYIDKDLIMDRLFPDMEVLEHQFRNVPLKERPTISVYCANPIEYQAAQMLAPSDFVVNFITGNHYPNQQPLREGKNRKEERIEFMSEMGERIVDYFGVAVGLAGIGSSFSRIISSKEISADSVFIAIGGVLLIAEAISGVIYDRLKKEE